MVLLGHKNFWNLWTFRKFTKRCFFVFLYFKISEQMYVPRKGCSVWIWFCSSLPWSDWGFSQLQRQKKSWVNKPNLKDLRIFKENLQRRVSTTKLVENRLPFCAMSSCRGFASVRRSIMFLLLFFPPQLSSGIPGERWVRSPFPAVPAALLSRRRPRPRGLAPPAAAGGEQQRGARIPGTAAADGKVGLEM